MTVIDTPPPEGGLGYYLEEVVYAIVLVLTVCGWSVVGFAVWVPLVFRSMMLLSATSFVASLTRDDNRRVLRARQDLYFAVRLYLRGFRHFIEFYRNRHADDAATGLLDDLPDLPWQQVVVSTIWALLFWTGTTLLAHHLLFPKPPVTNQSIEAQPSEHTSPPMPQRAVPETPNVVPKRRGAGGRK